MDRVLEPLGLVLKGGIWYLVARSGAEVAPRTYRISRIGAAVALDERFARPPDFDLAAHWTSTTAAYEADVPRVTVTLRVDPTRIWLLAALLGESSVQRATRLEADDAEGWIHLRLDIDWPSEAAPRLAGMGGAAEVLEPAEVRTTIHSLATAALARSRPRAVGPR